MVGMVAKCNPVCIIAIIITTIIRSEVRAVWGYSGDLGGVCHLLKAQRGLWRCFCGMKVKI